MYDPLGINPSYDPLGIDKETSWGVEDTLRSAGAVLGGFAAMPVAGVGGLSRLITTGNLDEASKTMEEISAVPSKILTTKQQKQTAEKVGGLFRGRLLRQVRDGVKLEKPLVSLMLNLFLVQWANLPQMVGVGGVKGAIKGRLKGK